MTGILDFISGYYVVVPEEDARAASLFLNQDVRTWNARRKNGRFSCCVSSADYRRLTAMGAGNFFASAQGKGLPALIRRYRKRPGIPLGILIFCVILGMSTQFIWRIEVKGCETIDEKEVRELLGELGVSVGAYIPPLDCHKICNRYLYESDDVAWITVNMAGTTAYVELLERKSPEKTEESVHNDAVCNITAAKSGVVQRLEVYSGMAVVKPGDYVEKGQLLISGVVETRYAGYRVTGASGRVIAQTSDILEYTQPREVKIKSATGEIIRETQYEVFGKILNLTLKQWTLPEKYDIITKEEQVTLFGAVRLPVIKRVSTCSGWVWRDVTLTGEELSREAWSKMNALIRQRFAGADIISRVTEQYETEDGYSIVCEFICEEDIALASPYQ